MGRAESTFGKGAYQALFKYGVIFKNFFFFCDVSMVSIKKDV